MAVILITHDLTVVRQFADYVYVMQHGEVREEGPTEALFTNPQHPYTKRLLGVRAEGHGRPAAQATTETVLEGRNIRVTYTLRKGGAFRGTYYDLQAVDGLSLDAASAARPWVWWANRGSGKTTFGQALLRLNTLTEGEIDFLGQRHRRAGPQGDEALPPAHADRVPGPVRQPQPAHVGAPDRSRKG